MSNLVPKQGTGLDRVRSTVLVRNVKLGSKLGTVLDRRCRTEVVLDIKVGAKLVTGLDRGLDTKLGLELGTARSKMNISVPTGNRRLWQ
jgi:hypothetical protein